MDTLRKATADAWRDYLARPAYADSLSQSPDYLVGRYHGLRDAYRLAGGSWADLTAALDAVEQVNA
jgi:hypothetical protein